MKYLEKDIDEWIYGTLSSPARENLVIEWLFARMFDMPGLHNLQLHLFVDALH